jgi:hypothetical protein
MVSWTDSTGDRWLFGGSGYGASGESGRLNDLWKLDILSKACDLLTLTLGGYDGTFDGLGISVQVPYGTEVSSLVTTFTSSPGSTVNATGGQAYDFTEPVELEVTAEDGVTTSTYLVTVTVLPPSAACDLMSLSVGGTAGVFQGLAVEAEVAYGTAVTALVLSFTSSPYSEVNATSGQAYDFTEPVELVVTAQDGTTQKVYIVTVTVLPNTACEILTFALGNSEGTIDGEEISVNVPFGTDVTALVATFTLSPGATVRVTDVLQTSGINANDFSSVVTYVVTAQDGATTKTYQVTVTIAPEAPADPKSGIDGYTFPLLLIISVGYIVLRKKHLRAR